MQSSERISELTLEQEYRSTGVRSTGQQLSQDRATTSPELIREREVFTAHNASDMSTYVERKDSVGTSRAGLRGSVNVNTVHYTSCCIHKLIFLTIL